MLDHFEDYFEAMPVKIGGKIMAYCEALSVKIEGILSYFEASWDKIGRTLSYFEALLVRIGGILADFEGLSVTIEGRHQPIQDPTAKST